MGRATHWTTDATEMTTKRALLIASGVVAAVALVVAVVAGAVVGFAFYTLDRSAAAQTAKTFLRQNERLKQEIGEVRDFGYFTSGSIGTQGAPGEAELRLKTIGVNRTVNATVSLATRGGQDWRVVDAFFDEPSGERIYLTKNFDDADAQDDKNPLTAGDEGETDQIDSSNSNDAKPNGSDARAGGNETTNDGDEPPHRFSEEGFKLDVLAAKSPVVVVIGSQKDSDSRELEEALDLVEPKYDEKINLVDYDLDEQPDLRRRFAVQRVPTIIIYKDGKEQERRAGNISAQELSLLLDKYLAK